MSNTGIQQILNNGICIFLLAFSLFKILRTRNNRYPYVNAFIIANICADVFEVLTVLVLSDLLPTSPAILYVLRNGYNCSALAAAGCWFMNSLQITHNRLEQKKLLLCTVMLPLAAMAVLTLTTGSHRKIFYIESSGQYFRGAWFGSFMAVACAYLFVALCFYVYADLNKEIYIFKSLNRASSIYTLLLIIFSIIQIRSSGTMSVINTAAALISLMIHEDFQQKEITMDALTRLNNRNAINEHLLKMLKHQNRSGYAIMLDVDFFKQINDRYGHIEGDRALNIVADALRMTFEDNSFYGRLGGDEFMIICEHDDSAEAEAVEERINKNIAVLLQETKARFELTVSTGLCRIDSTMKTIPDVIKAADDMLYKRKAEKKSQRYE